MEKLITFVVAFMLVTSIVLLGMALITAYAIGKHYGVFQ